MSDVKVELKELSAGLENLSLLHDNVKLEVGGADNPIDVSTEGFTDLFISVGDFLFGAFKKSSKILGTRAIPSSKVKEIINLSPEKLNELIVPCTDGFPGDALGYLKLFEQLEKELFQNFLNDVLYPFDLLLASYLNKPAELGKISQNPLARKIKLVDVKSIRNRLLDYTSNDHFETNLFPIQYQDIGKFQEVNDNIDKVIVSYDKYKDDDVVKLINQIADKAKLLTTYLKSESGVTERYNLSVAIAKELSDITFKVAEHCEVYSLTRLSLNYFANRHYAVRDVKTK